MSKASAEPQPAAPCAEATAVRTLAVACPICDQDRPRPYRADMYGLAGVRFHLVRCPCGMVYVNPRPDGAALARMYADPDYYAQGYNLGVETENYFARRHELIAQYESAARELIRETGQAGDLLELGSAGGFFLEGARRAGFRVRGVEVSRVASEYSRRELALDVFEGELSEAPFPDASFDLAFVDNVLEHTTAPEDVLKKLHALLRPGGHLVVIVPSYVNSSWFRALLAVRRALPRRFLGRALLRILKLDDEYDGGPPYHILEFDRRTLCALVERAGFESVRVEGSVPLPAHVFKVARLDLRTRVLRLAFRTIDWTMRHGLAPGARLRLLARKR